MGLTITEFDIIIDAVKRVVGGDELVFARDYECKRCYTVHVSVNQSRTLLESKLRGLCEYCLDEELNDE